MWCQNLDFLPHMRKRYDYIYIWATVRKSNFSLVRWKSTHWKKDIYYVCFKDIELFLLGVHVSWEYTIFACQWCKLFKWNFWGGTNQNEGNYRWFIAKIIFFRVRAFRLSPSLSVTLDLHGISSKEVTFFFWRLGSTAFTFVYVILYLGKI